jgi:hypothetical protein
MPRVHCLSVSFGVGHLAHHAGSANVGGANCVCGKMRAHPPFQSSTYPRTPPAVLDTGSSQTNRNHPDQTDPLWLFLASVSLAAHHALVFSFGLLNGLALLSRIASQTPHQRAWGECLLFGPIRSVLTGRLAHLLSQRGVSPSNLLHAAFIQRTGCDTKIASPPPCIQASPARRAWPSRSSAAMVGRSSSHESP